MKKLPKFSVFLTFIRLHNYDVYFLVIPPILSAEYRLFCGKETRFFRERTSVKEQKERETG